MLMITQSDRVALQLQTKLRRPPFERELNEAILIQSRKGSRVFLHPSGPNSVATIRSLWIALTLEPTSSLSSSSLRRSSGFKSVIGHYNLEHVPRKRPLSQIII